MDLIFINIKKLSKKNIIFVNYITELNENYL